MLDREPPTPVVELFLDEHRDRLTFAVGDIADPTAFDGLEHATVVIHAATVTHVPEWEAATPRRYVDVNLVGGLFMRAEWEYVRFTSTVDTSITTIRMVPSPTMM